MDKLLRFCPKCGSGSITIEPEPGQYTLICSHCSLYCEIMVIDEGNFDHPEGS